MHDNYANSSQYELFFIIIHLINIFLVHSRTNRRIINFLSNVSMMGMGSATKIKILLLNSCNKADNDDE